MAKLYISRIKKMKKKILYLCIIIFSVMIMNYDLSIYKTDMNLNLSDLNYQITNNELLAYMDMPEMGACGKENCDISAGGECALIVYADGGYAICQSAPKW